MLKMVFIGSRGHFFYAVNGLAKVNNVEVCGVSSGCEDSPDRLLTALGNLKIFPKVFSDYRLMLKEVNPDIVCIDGPFDRHAQMCIDAFRAGAHVFCEKPVALTVADLELVKSEWVKANKPCFVTMLGIRYEPAFYAAYQILESGVLGRIKMISARKSYKLGTRPEFYRTRSTYGGTLPWVGSHAVSWILAFSRSHFKEVYASHSMEDNFDNGNLEIAGQMFFVMQNGIQASATIDFLRPQSAPTHGDDRLRVAGTGGVLEIADGKIALLTPDKSEVMTPDEDNVPDMFADFVAQITGCGSSEPETLEMLELTLGCLLARESADQNKIMTF